MNLKTFIKRTMNLFKKEHFLDLLCSLKELPYLPQSYLIIRRFVTQTKGN